MNTFQKSAAVFNKFVMVVLKAPVLDKALGRSTGVLTYTGRKSGKTISLPVSYKRAGNDLVVAVMLPDKKNWWRNFQGDGGPVTFATAGVERAGHAVTARDEKGRLTVTITPDAEAS